MPIPIRHDNPVHGDTHQRLVLRRASANQEAFGQQFQMKVSSLVHTGDCLEVMRSMPDASVSAVVTDPPYGIAFMGKEWDRDVPPVDVWRECLRLLKPGGHLLAFAGTRTQHRMASRIESAGFEIRDMLAWVYGSGFPKGLDVAKAIDKARTEDVGANREVPITMPETEGAKTWQGWGTALKPAIEPVTLARKPLTGTVAANVLKHGAGALNIDACRVGSTGGTTRSHQAPVSENGWRKGHSIESLDSGRWPANFIHDGDDEVADLLPLEQGDSASRFFYCAKPSASERGRGNNHATVKPVDLMRYLIRLVTPPGGLVLDPFAGSGTTGIAAVCEGVSFIGIELDAGHADLARKRITAEAPLFVQASDGVGVAS